MLYSVIYVIVALSVTAVQEKSISINDSSELYCNGAWFCSDRFLTSNYSSTIYASVHISSTLLLYIWPLYHDAWWGNALDSVFSLNNRIVNSKSKYIYWSWELNICLACMVFLFCFFYKQNILLHKIQRVL